MRRNLLKRIVQVAFPIVMVGVFLMAVSNLKKGNGSEGKKQLEQAIKRSVVTCYATEGVYPSNFEYVEEHYGIQVDENRYTVIYEVFAENLMPNITVLEKDYEE